MKANSAPFKMAAKASALIALMALTGTAQAVPKYGAMTLPIDNRMTMDKSLLEFLASFTVQQDSDDPNLYYYTPIFKAVPRDGGAATVIINASQIKRDDEVNGFEDDLVLIAEGNRKVLEVQINTLRAKLINLKPSEESERQPLKDLLASLEAQQADLIKKASDYTSTIPAGLRKTLMDRIGDLLAEAGFSANVEDSASRHKALSQLAQSNGGILTANIYAGLKPKDLERARAYKAERARLGLPEIRIAKLPVENFTWGSLTETVTLDDGKSASLGVPLLRKVSGGGNYEGATITMDLTLDGARAFQVAPPPMVLPIYANANLIQKYPAFKAELDCDFTTGWQLDGRSDVRDGLIIYNNDVTNNFVGTDISSSDHPCTVLFTGGGASSNAAREAAIRQSYSAIQDRLEGIFEYRSNLSMEDKRAYWQHVQDDIQANRHTGANKGWTETITAFSVGGWSMGFASVASRSSQFYWHTDIEHIKMLSQMKWQQQLIDDGNTTISTPIATSVCIAYDPDKKVYMACSDDEAAHASSTTDAVAGAKKSPECSGAKTTNECGQNRSTSSPRSSDGTIAPPDNV